MSINENPTETEDSTKKGFVYGIVDKPFFTKSVYAIFLWIMFGISIFYGIRFYHNDPVHSTFIPLVGAAFGAALAFAIVISLRSVVGEITIQFGEYRKFEGASGPIILWCICFLVIVFGLYLVGLSDAVTAANDNFSGCSIGQLVSGACDKAP